MKQFAVLFLLSLTFSINAQEAETTKLKRQVGFDINSVNRLLPLDNSIGTSAPFLLHYIKYENDSKYKVYGLNIELNGSLDFLESNPNRNTFQIVGDFKFGKGKVFDNWKKFYFHMGYNNQLRLEYELVKIKESFDGLDDGNSKNDLSLHYGIGPYAGLEFRFSDKLSLYTQFRYKLGLTTSYAVFKSELDPELDNKDMKIRLNDSFSFPTWIVLFYSF